MIGTSRTVRVFAYGEATDMRKGYDGLGAVVRQKMGSDPLSGDLYLFTNARRNRAKVLLFDGTGMAIYMKRLDVGRFACPWTRGDGETLRLSMSELGLFLEGCELVFRRPLSPEPVTERRFQIETVVE
jgi:transposase